MQKESKPEKKERAKKLTKLVSFRLTEEDHAVYASKVVAAGVRPSVFFRDAVLTNKTQIVARVKASPEKGRLVYLMNKASNNINQLAKRANADHLGGVISEATYTKVLGELQAVSRCMKSVVKDVN